MCTCDARMKIGVLNLIYRNRTEKFFSNPIIAAVRDEKNLQKAIESRVSAIFLLTGNLLNLSALVIPCKKRQKYIFIHTDLVEGLGNDTGGVRYIAERIKPDGIISTRNNVIRSAKQFGVFTIQRYFCVDSLALHTGIKSIEQTGPDAVEILPGIIPRVVEYMTTHVKKPIITGGMVACKKDVMVSLRSGAIAVSTSCLELWDK